MFENVRKKCTFNPSCLMSVMHYDMKVRHFLFIYFSQSVADGFTYLYIHYKQVVKKVSEPSYVSDFSFYKMTPFIAVSTFRSINFFYNNKSNTISNLLNNPI